MSSNSSLYRSFPAKSVFLALAFFVIFPVLPVVTVEGSPNNAVNVNARIQPARMVKIDEGHSDQTGQEAFTAIDLTDFERTGRGKIEIEETIHLKIGSNVSWQLAARIENLDSSRKKIRSSGWKLHLLRIYWAGGELELTSSARTMLAGDKGMHDFEITYEIVIRRTSQKASRLRLKELENVLLFTFE